MSRPRLDGSRPHVRIGSLIVAIWLAGGPRTTLAADPPIPEGIVVYHDLSYREGTSRQWKLDLAMKKDLRRQAEARHRGHPRRRMDRRG